MAWWWWVLLWAVLVLGAAGVFFVLGRSLWRRAKALLGELEVASTRLGAVSDGLAELAGTDSGPAVFSDPSRLRQERFLTGRGREGKRGTTTSATGGRPTLKSRTGA